MRKPCENCPWRKDAPREYWHPDHFRQIWTNCQDDGVHVMQCHKSIDGSHLVCQGWLRVMQTDAVGVRISLIQGTVTLEEMHDTETVDLFDTFEEMLEANNIPIPPRNTFK